MLAVCWCGVEWSGHRNKHGVLYQQQTYLIITYSHRIIPLNPYFMKLEAWYGILTRTRKQCPNLEVQPTSQQEALVWSVFKFTVFRQPSTSLLPSPLNSVLRYQAAINTRIRFEKQVAEEERHKQLIWYLLSVYQETQSVHLDPRTYIFHQASWVDDTSIAVHRRKRTFYCVTLSVL
ncbi:hypothetical protein Pmani_035619 [Petrolisthes manimaculis]|uniref:Uncharacterized protein n=1 Tax=Petrolisthes manimaculis TaxID=1843537 RepID=A0AAE1TQA1_9EUCA|nr:hypothetical protein Pmani_035619 [Petrolisthes manimaculis]